MKNVLWILSAFFLVFSIYMSVMNWAVFFNNYVLKKKWTSAIPFFGGVSGVIGLLLIPIAAAKQYWWTPLLLDWGSLPVVVYSIVYRLRNNRGEQNHKPKIKS